MVDESFTTPTMGMRLDDAIQSLDNLNSTQLYVLIIVITIALSFTVLPNGLPEPQQQQRAAPPPPLDAAAHTTRKRRTSIEGRPEPKWHIFKWVNYAALCVFLYSVFDFSMHCNVYVAESHTLAKFLVGWSVLLCYFFGFFGVSLVHDTMMEEEQNQVHEHEPISNMMIHTATSVTSGTTANITPLTVSDIHSIPSSVPCQSTNLFRDACDTTEAPVCSDPTSTTTSRTGHTTIVAQHSYKNMSNEQVADLVLTNQLKDHELEQRFNAHRAVLIRRLVINHKLRLSRRGNIENGLGALDKLPHQHTLDYGRVHGANCEIVVGFVPIPVGIVGPLTLNDESIFIPMATTEGCLVASTNRGAKAITQGGGATAVVLRDGITRAPCVRMPSAEQAAALKLWCERLENFTKLKKVFESTTSFGKLLNCSPTVAGKNVYLRLRCFSGDAMGMNMVSKGSLAVIECLKNEFAELQLVALSGNMCTDKKAAAMNWIEGRGKSVVVEATIPKEIVRNTLKTNVQAMVHTNLHKNLIGSAMAGTIGGFNAHASNIVTAVFLATGQDPAQNVESSNCITILEESESGDLWASCTMPSLEVGTVGGGTSLEAQSACLQVIGCNGGGSVPGENAQRLAKVVAAATLAGELSLLAALAANTLVAAHMQHNRKSR